MKTIKLFLMALVMILVISGGYAATATQSSLIASFMADVNTGAAPLTVHFTDESTGNPTGWQWDFGDGSSSTLQNPVYTYNTPGTYTVNLTVTDGTNSSSTSADIVVTNPMVTTPTPTPTTTPIIIEPIPIREPHHDQPHHDQPPTHDHPAPTLTPTPDPGDHHKHG